MLAAAELVNIVDTGDMVESVGDVLKFIKILYFSFDYPLYYSIGVFITKKTDHESFMGSFLSIM